MSGSRKQQLLGLMKDLKINEKIFSDQDLKLFEKGGFSIGDSDSEGLNDSQSLRDSQISDKPLNLPFQSQRADLDVLALKTKYTSIISMLEKQNAYLQQEIGRVQTTNEADIRKLRNDNQIENDRLQGEIRLLRGKQLQSEGQIPLIKEAFSKVRDMLNGLIPETTYLKLRDIPEKDLTPSEWVLIQCYDLVYPFKREMEQSKKETHALRQEIQLSNDKQANQLNELEHATRLLYDKDEDYKRHILNYENSRKSLEMELLKKQEELELQREKSQSYDSLMRDFKMIEQEKFLLEERLVYYDKNQGTTADSKGKNDFWRQQDDLRRKIDLLQSDKEYLTKENISLLEKNKRLEDRIDKLEHEVIDAKNQSQDYLHQLLNLRNNSAIDYEQRINRELNDLKEKSQREMEITRSNLVEIYEKQIRFLREQKEEYEIKADSCMNQVKEKQTAYDNLLLENRQLQRRVETDMADLRIQIRLKTEDAERSSNMYEEANANCKATKLENEMIREKLNVLKAEFYKSEVQAKEDYIETKAQLAVAKEQLLNYENIENEIDQAIQQMGTGLGADKDNIYLNTIQTAPTSTKRRIQQALSLAKRLEAKQRELDQLNQNVRKMQTENENLKEELTAAKDLLDKTNQPYSYLIQSVEEKDKDILKYKQILRKCEKDLELLKQENKDLENAYDKSQQDAKKLLIKRENIHNIQNLLLSMVHNQTGNIQGNAQKVVEDIQYFLNNSGKNDNLTFNAPRQEQYEQPVRQTAKESLQTPQWAQKLKSTLKK